MVFQNYALYPHMTVGENIATPLKMSRLGLLQRQPFIGPLIGSFSTSRKLILQQIDSEVANLCSSLQIENLINRKPSQLSGGQRQRVALARAMVRQPDAFLMDEPLSNLDAKLRVQVREELADLHHRIGSTFLYVTHDQTEALTLSNRVAVMDQGQILQIGTPSELYQFPANLTVAKFIGTPSMNILPVDAANAPDIDFKLLPSSFIQDKSLVRHIGIRPENMLIGWSGHELRPGLDIQFEASVHRAEHHGSEWVYVLKVSQWQGTFVTVKVPNQNLSNPLPYGSGVMVGWQLSDQHLFDKKGCRIAVLNHSN